MPRSSPAPGSPEEALRRALSGLPAVATVLDSAGGTALVRRFGPGLVTELIREALDETRRHIRERTGSEAESASVTTVEDVCEAVSDAAEAILRPSPREVINATGIVVHTNLGRSVLSRSAATDLARAASGYMDLEYDVSAGSRGSRMDHLSPLMARLFPGQGFTVVNNNAAAIVLVLRALCAGREAVVSRGELVEIGGSFRVPDMMIASGAVLREVGTTNRTRLSDYRSAVCEGTGVLLKVHTSNFRIVGFTEETTLPELAGLAREAGAPLVVDWGSGDLVDLGPVGIHDEMPIAAVLEAGADVVTFSGDKLMGGPQAGFIVGRPDLIARIRKDPMARVCRLDRLLIGVLHRTLASYVTGRAFEEIPTLAMIAAEPQTIGRRAERLRRRLIEATGREDLFSVEDGVSRTGGGSSPTGERPTRVLAVRWPDGDAGRLESRLRSGGTPVIARIHDGRLLIDLRTVSRGDDERLARLVVAALGDGIGTA